MSINSFLQSLNDQTLSVGAVVLAGGLARRMEGQDKGLIEIQGRPMAAWVLEQIRPQVHDIVINANRNQAAYEALGADVIPDRHTGHIGPLAGLSAAMHNATNEYVFMCPCDSPFIDATLVETLGGACLKQDADVAVANDGVRMQPVFCMVNRRCLESLDAYLESGERKIDRWYAQVNTVEVDCSPLAGSFRNINTEQERLAAERELIT